MTKTGTGEKVPAVYEFMDIAFEKNFKLTNFKKDIDTLENDKILSMPYQSSNGRKDILLSEP